MLRKNLFRKLINLYKGKLKYVLFPLLFVIGIAFLLWFVLIRNPLFTVKSIVIEPESLSLVSVLDIRKVLENKFLGGSIILRGKDLENIVYANFPIVKNITYTIKLPSTIVIRLEQREPSLYVKTNLQESYYLVDSTGFVLGVSDAYDPALPLINYMGSMVFSGGRLSEDSISAINFLEELRKIKVDVDTCTIDDVIVITLKNLGTRVTVSKLPADQVDEKAILLQKILQKYSIEGKKIGKIDLRFSNPIIDF